MIRLLLGLPLAGFITVALFMVMRFLVLPGDEGPPEAGDTVTINLARQDRDEDLNTRNRNKPDRPEQQDAPPPPPPMQVDARVDPADLAGNMGMPNFGVDVGNLDAPSDRTAIPLVTVPPIYPDRAASRGVEGWVLVEFDITPTGQAVDPRVIDYDPSTIFNRAAIKAIKKWKFKPKVVNGKPVAQFNKEYMLTFQLEK